MKTAVVPALVLVLVGCGEQAMAVDEYRDAVQARAIAFADEGEQIRVDHLNGLEQSVNALVKKTDPEDLEAAVVAETARRTAALFASLGDAVYRYVADLSALRPPEPLRAAHQELIAALRSSIANLPTTMDALADAVSLADVDAAIGGSPFNDAAARVDTACRRLEDALAGLDAAADLRCPED
jgi:hypothetical protein